MPNPSRSGAEKRVAGFLYHLGKGLWKSVPILGPIVEEVLYEQFENELKRRVGSLSDEDLQRIRESLPSLDIESIEHKMEAISEKEKQFNMEQFGLLLSCIERERTVIDNHLLTIDKNTSLLPSIREIILDLMGKIGNEASLRIALSELERKRRVWVQRISRNQRLLLDQIPTEFTSIDDLWIICRNIILECNYKEFRFRLHELEWLNLIERIRDGNKWFYRHLGNDSEIYHAISDR